MPFREVRMIRSPVLASLVLALAAALPAAAAEPVLIRNVRIFDGVAAETRAGDVLVVDGRIDRIAPPGSVEAPAGGLVVDGGGRLLTPGFIDLHAHLGLQMPRDQLHVHPTVAGALAGKAAATYVENGFTTVRDAGGTHPDLARAIAAGLLVGPRVYPSGAIVTQTSGHGDFRRPEAPHPTLCNCGLGHEVGAGLSVIADGPAETLAAVRENLRHGATQIKIMGGGGVASDYDPIHTLQPAPEEIRAAVQAASDWGTYVTAHSYTAPAIRRLVENGVKMIEHGLLIDDETARLCAEKGVVISTQVAIFRLGAEKVEGFTEENRRKMQEVLAGQDRLISLMKKYELKVGFGTDLVFGSLDLLGEEFTLRADYFTPLEILRQATSESAEIIRMAGPLDRHGDFGEIREGWLADLLIIDGDPLADIQVLADPAQAVVLVMKEGTVLKNALPES
jgi:imidazolonepropionase-like amidohydrolase